MNKKVLYLHSNVGFAQSAMIMHDNAEDGISQSFLLVGTYDDTAGAAIEIFAQNIGKLLPEATGSFHGSAVFDKPAILAVNSYDEVASYDMVMTVIVALSSYFTFPVDHEKPELGFRTVYDIVEDIYQWVVEELDAPVYASEFFYDGML
jgi:hypothetical protein